MREFEINGIMYCITDKCHLYMQTRDVKGTTYLQEIPRMVMTFMKEQVFNGHYVETLEYYVGMTLKEARGQNETKKHNR